MHVTDVNFNRWKGRREDVATSSKAGLGWGESLQMCCSFDREKQMDWPVDLGRSKFQDLRTSQSIWGIVGPPSSQFLGHETNTRIYGFVRGLAILPRISQLGIISLQKAFASPTWEEYTISMSISCQAIIDYWFWNILKINLSLLVCKLDQLLAYGCFLK